MELVLALLALASVALLLGGCSSDSDETTAEQATEVAEVAEGVYWGVADSTPTNNPREVKIGTKLEHCPGDPKPHIAGIVQRPAGNLTYITFTVEGGKIETGKCPEQKVRLYRTIQLADDLESLALYDTSTAPATQRWP